MAGCRSQAVYAPATAERDASHGSNGAGFSAASMVISPEQLQQPGAGAASPASTHAYDPPPSEFSRLQLYPIPGD